ncbi:MAG: hypothetical protein ABIZ80_26020 [Bryobacteraceae bacterium]
MADRAWNFEQQPHEPAGETGVNLRAYFDQMPREKMRHYAGTVERRTTRRVGW